MRIGLLAFVIMILAISTGCSRNQEQDSTATPTEQQLATEDPGYPAPVIPTIQPPYPEPDISPDPSDGIIDLDAMLENLNPGLGAVTGILLDNNNPRQNAIIYLAEVVTDEQGREMVASYDRSSSPRFDTDAVGRFVFINIPPGRYGLILDTVISAYLLHHPNEDLPMLFTITADELKDIGELDYDNLPLP